MHSDTVNPKEQQFDAIIVGGGMVGCSLAIALAEISDQFSIALLESANTFAQYTAEAFDPRVVALSKKSSQFLQGIGVWQDISLQRLCPYFHMTIWDSEGTGKLEFDCDDQHEDNLGHIVENSVVVKALQQKIETLRNIVFLQGVGCKDVNFYQDDCERNTIVTDSGHKLTAPLLIAADGAKSSLRSKALLETREWDYGHTAIVTTVKTSLSHQFTAWQVFTSDGPLAFLPLSDRPVSEKDEASQNYCSIVWSLNSERAKEYLSLPDSEFIQRLELVFEKKLGSILEVDKRYGIPLRQRHAKHYVRPGFALVGDAAHTIHPLAGQGVNLGFYDVEALALEINRAWQRKVPLQHYSILNRYQRSRMGHNLATMSAMEFFKRVYGAESPAIRVLRNVGMTFVDQHPWLKSRLSQIAGGL
ncbi:UbiH/UbiF/VisC/COQ6 family ubiquinone biosynthesis hydroxylase [Teredinibacter sp. KSP-S5-2]|uniref:UbiH/UbiF/VisC/COQ6 family ubiquinone biosynthesis hydroxylase n=1 Tax=Teredinibacter sp. KSP-S5-2 TaxID=3034506 RepID=UPI00293530C9|nr:UbiH/UbiF/VisC/COQ6 family ubiquinone biosynthesis hydroxylase [Teredinibacter sp. KSP-S5-2]WNO08835.1 UbiH/UbiF/VisC/COQ6 family ubiquinone biosynthesis hydroxylase [Teredinibacter sp. KSP-S5-2]